MPDVGQNKRAVRRFLVSAFPSKKELRRFMRDEYVDFATLVDFDGSEEDSSESVVEVLHSQSQIDANFFASLRTELPAALHPKVDQLEADWHSTPPGVDPLDCTMPTGIPFIDRTEVRDTVRAIRDGTGPPLHLIFGTERTGKSHCTLLLRHLEAIDSNFRPCICDMKDFENPTAAVVADDIAATMGLDIPLFADLDNQASTNGKTWIKKFDLAVRETNKQWCLYLDSLSTDTTPSATLEFLEALALHLCSVPALRVAVVLAGLKRDDLAAPDLRHRAPREGELGGFSRADIERWLHAAAIESDRTLATDVLKTELDALFPDTTVKVAPETAVEEVRKIMGKVSP